MLSTEDYKKWDVYYTNRFRDKAAEGNLAERPDQTAEIIQLERRIKEREVEVRNLRMELHQAEKSFRTVIDEQRVRIAKKSLGVRDVAENLIIEVHERAQKVKKLRGEDLGWRSNHGGQYPTIRQFVKSGTYGNGYHNDRDFHPLFVETQLLGAALGVISQSTAKKDSDLYDRVYMQFTKVRNEHYEIGQPVDRKEQSYDDT